MASTPSMADLQLSTQIEARFSRLGKVDPFTTLGLQPTASKEQIKAAYLSLAKTFHPDRLPPSLPHLAQKMSAVFESIRQAYETLFDDARRSAYLAQRPAGGAAAQPGTPSAQAQELLKLGEAFFKKRDYRQAEQHFARAYAADPSATALAAQAWAVYMDPTRKAEVPQAREMMQRALSLDPHSDRANYQLGVIARVEGNMELAERHFREAVRVNPRHLEATQELRLIDLRKKRATEPPKKGGGFFG
jgi:tetratricopeptide (TPR) repeat protein